MPLTKLGDPTMMTFGSHGPVAGAADGRSWTPTETASVIVADMIPARPSQPIHPIFSSVWKSEMAMVMTKPTTTKTTVHVPCSVMAFMATEKESRPAPQMAVRRSLGVSLRASTVSSSG
jgi:hypothetical protein